MRPKKHRTTGSNDLFRARLDQVINMKHELVQLAGKIDWDWIDGEVAPLYSENGRPGIETRFMIGLLLLKHTYGLSDEGVCERWVHDPYFQFFTGEEFFQHAFPHERSDLSHWRKRLGDKLESLLAESLRVAHEAGALRGQDLKRVTVDTTVQPKAITFPTDAKLLHAAIKGLNRLARRHAVRLRQSYSRVAKAAAMMAGRYAHAKQFSRHQRQLRILRSRLGRIIRDVRRKIEGQPALEEAFALPLGVPRPPRSKSTYHLHLRPKARRLRLHQARAAPPLRHRAHHRPHEDRRSPRSLLSQRPCRRRRQRHPLSRRPQLPPHPSLAQRTLVPVPGPTMPRAGRSSPAQFAFLTDDYLAFIKLASIRIWLRANESTP